MAHRGRAKPAAYHCAICELSFSSKAEFKHHTANHDDTSTTKLVCATCGWYFDDSHALELHQIQSSHAPSQPAFTSSTAALTPSIDEMAVHCDRCQKHFVTQKQYSNHRSNMASGCADWKHTTTTTTRPQPPTPTVVATGYVDLDKPNDEPSVVPNYDDSASSSSNSIDSDIGIKCKDCKRTFHSMGHYNNHMLGCTPVSTTTQVREVLPGTASGRPTPRGAPSGPRATPPTTRQNIPQQQFAFARPTLQQPRLPAPQLPHTPTSINMGGVADLEQAKSIQAKTQRLLIQSDVFILHDGKINVCDILWTRVGVAKQHDVVTMLDGMCHLPKMLQGEHIPPPKALKEDYKAQYLSGDFKPSPKRNIAKPGLGAVAIACSKVLLGDGCPEVVKIAAIDLVTSRILMNHLVCTDPRAKVKDWYSSVTGLFSWGDMEGARKAGYKIFKGWAAARDALHRFVDKETIIVGYNLRSDLDALRMIHGRAVDIAKVVEKAAQGPLSKAQLALDGLCRDYPAINLKSDPEYGRDSLMNAFAVREFGLWAIKNSDKLVSVARQKSREYQLVMPKAAVAGA
ncbi:hypothetical protein BKA58DRAFT_361689 [Alternaria rosae]|uniref:uncharacterized protein n=1 Tax=Alternaria rosae TaxID=1187941 RepID=UPI001E8EA05B|nr:uncharacterized protein BKA58DRAFT_361689 [Alternaria rosae]KAH6870677.1 hypothetical protein BKA58DRAFT_361689 [Alternaria rosae]